MKITAKVASVFMIVGSALLLIIAAFIYCNAIAALKGIFQEAHWIKTYKHDAFICLGGMSLLLAGSTFYYVKRRYILAIFMNIAVLLWIVWCVYFLEIVPTHPIG